jgi:AcrR family transcriptional regulator
VILSGNEKMPVNVDRRATRTRAALIGAFNQLLLTHRKNIRVADIVALANVGRSTFYEHYRSVDDIHLQAMSRPFAILADAAAGMGDEARLTSLLRHFWENRQLARSSFMGRMQDKVTRLLAGMIEERLREEAHALAIPLRLAALQLADSALAPLRGWVIAEAFCAPEALAGSLCRCGQAMRAALAKDASREDATAA